MESQQQLETPPSQDPTQLAQEEEDGDAELNFEKVQQPEIENPKQDEQIEQTEVETETMEENKSKNKESQKLKTQLTEQKEEEESKAVIEEKTSQDFFGYKSRAAFKWTEQKGNEVQQTIYEYISMATFTKKQHNPCRLRNGRCPKKCGHSISSWFFHLDQLQVQENPEFKQVQGKPIKLEAGDNLMICQSDMPEDCREVVETLKANDKVTLQWNHDQLTIEQTPAPQRIPCNCEKHREEKIIVGYEGGGSRIKISVENQSHSHNQEIEHVELPSKVVQKHPVTNLFKL